jgi:hypothetical protein
MYRITDRITKYVHNDQNNSRQKIQIARGVERQYHLSIFFRFVDYVINQKCI